MENRPDHSFQDHRWQPGRRAVVAGATERLATILKTIELEAGTASGEIPPAYAGEANQPVS